MTTRHHRRLLAILPGSFLSIIFGVSVVFGQAGDRVVSVTFDDLPATGPSSTLARLSYITDGILRSLRVRGIPGAGFVNEGKLFVDGEIDERTALLERWLDNGHLLGNHTFSHIAIDRAGFEEYKEDLIRGETVTKMLLAARGKELRYFRHTQLRTGPDKEYADRLSALLALRGYTVAPVTIDNNEYVFAAIYASARERGDRVATERIAKAYVGYMETVFDHFEKVSRDFLGYEPPQILLLHANELNADHFGRLADMIKARGYRFVTLDEALRDKAYRLPEALSRRGLSWIHRWMLAKGLEMREEPDVPEWVAEQFRSRQ